MTTSVPYLFVDDLPDTVQPIREALGRITDLGATRYEEVGGVARSVAEAQATIAKARREGRLGQGQRLLLFLDLSVDPERTDASDALTHELAEPGIGPLVPIICAKAPQTQAFATYLERGAVDVWKKQQIKADPAWLQQRLRYVVSEHLLGCPVHGRKCSQYRAERALLDSGAVSVHRHENLFVATPFLDPGDASQARFHSWIEQIKLKSAAKYRTYTVESTGTRAAPGLLDNIRAHLHCAARAVAIIEDPRRGGAGGLVNPNVLIELGMMVEWAREGEREFRVVGEHGTIDTPADLRGWLMESPDPAKLDWIAKWL